MALFGLFGSKNPSSQPERQVDQSPVGAILHFRDVPKENTEISPGNRYPMRDDPIPFESVDYVLSTQAELIQEIKQAVPIGEEEKDAFLFPVIRQLAAYTHLLPASSHYHHSARGGLFRHSLEVGLYTVNRARTHIFDLGENPDVRHKNRGRWFVACCVAGLMHDIGKVLVNMTVSGDVGRTLWRPSTESLASWGTRENLTEYYVSWRASGMDPDQHEWAGATLYWALVPEVTRLYIESSNSQRMMTDLYDALAGVTRSGKLIANLVKKADMASTREDLLRIGEDGKVRQGVDTPFASIIEGIIADLIESKTWRLNDTKDVAACPAWITQRGLFLNWDAAYPGIVKGLDDRKIQSVVRDRQIIAEKLCEGGLCDFVDPGSGTQIFWKVLPIDKVLEDRPTKQEEVNEETGEVIASWFDEDGNPYKYEYINCLRVNNPARLFEHITRPAKTLAAVMTEKLTDEEIRRWCDTCGMQPPETSSDWPEGIMRELSQEADRVAKEEALSATYFDEYGNPITPMPQLSESDWDSIEKVVPPAENAGFLSTLEPNSVSIVIEPDSKQDVAPKVHPLVESVSTVESTEETMTTQSDKSPEVASQEPVHRVFKLQDFMETKAEVKEKRTIIQKNDFLTKTPKSSDKPQKTTKSDSKSAAVIHREADKVKKENANKNASARKQTVTPVKTVVPPDPVDAKKPSRPRTKGFDSALGIPSSAWTTYRQNEPGEELDRLIAQLKEELLKGQGALIDQYRRDGGWAMTGSAAVKNALSVPESWDGLVLRVKTSKDMRFDRKTETISLKLPQTTQQGES